MGTSNSFSRRESMWGGGAGAAAVVLLDKDGVVLKPPVRLVKLEVIVDPLRVRERMRKGFLSVKVDFQGDTDEEKGEVLLLDWKSHWVTRPDRVGVVVAELGLRFSEGVVGGRVSVGVVGGRWVVPDEGESSTGIGGNGLSCRLVLVLVGVLEGIVTLLACGSLGGSGFDTTSPQPLAESSLV